MDGLVDLHAHVLPGIDDGPASLSEAIEMLHAAAQAGTATIVATPHLRPDFPDVRVGELATRCEQVRQAISQQQIDIRLVAGAEVSLAWALDATEDELRLASYGQNGTDLLIETPSGNVVGLGTLLYELRAKGFRIILAHPERSPDFQSDPTLLTELARQGVLLQVNADALIAETRHSRQGRLARHICAQGLADVLASDGHRAVGWRPVTDLSVGVKSAASLIGLERARWMSVDAPAAIVSGTEPPEPPPIATARRRWRLRNRW